MTPDVLDLDTSGASGMVSVPATLFIELVSDTTPGRGDGVAGLVDQDVVYDRDGFPYLPGRTIKGLLSEATDDLIAVLSPAMRAGWRDEVRTLYGRPGSAYDGAILHIDDALLPQGLRRGVARQVRAWRWAQESKPKQPSPSDALAPGDVLDALTVIRRQTAVDAMSGAPDDRSLRSTRLVVRGLVFAAALTFEQPPSPRSLALLDAGALALRRLGQGRNRGRGCVRCALMARDGAALSGSYASLLLDGE